MQVFLISTDSPDISSRGWACCDTLNAQQLELMTTKRGITVSVVPLGRGIAQRDAIAPLGAGILDSLSSDGVWYAWLLSLHSTTQLSSSRFRISTGATAMRTFGSATGVGHGRSAWRPLNLSVCGKHCAQFCKSRKSRVKGCRLRATKQY